MKKLALVLLAAASLTGTAGVASAQWYGGGYYGPGPYYGDRYRERYYGDGRYYPGGQIYYPPGRYRTYNGCQRMWTVQDGLCKPYTGPIYPVPRYYR
jgi:hypothetical protein